MMYRACCHAKQRTALTERFSVTGSTLFVLLDYIEFGCGVAEQLG